VLLRRRKETDDMLRLLAAVAQVRDYEPPGTDLDELLDDLGGRAKDPALRGAQVAAFLLAAGGDG